MQQSLFKDNFVDMMGLGLTWRGTEVSTGVDNNILKIISN
jgi:hypothetical protein